MVIRLTVFLLLATLGFMLPAKGDAISAAIMHFGLMGSWAEDCGDGNGRNGIRIVVDVPSTGPATYTSLNMDDGAKTTIRSVVLAADPLSPRRLKLRMRIVGGDVDGGPLPSPTTSTFEQTFGKLADGGLQMAGNSPIPLKRCRS
jgi:hypothetical protein